MARLEIDDNRCMGHGMCYATAPSLLTDDDEGYVAERGSVVEVPAEYAEEAERASRACPEMAITFTAGG